MAIRRVMVDVDEKGLDPEQPHSDIHKGKLFNVRTEKKVEHTEVKVNIEASPAEPEPEVELQPSVHEKRLRRRAFKEDQGDPAAD